MDTLPEFLFDKLERMPDRPAVMAWRDADWQLRTWREFASDVAALARELTEAGIGSGDRVALVSENRYEWPVLDLAIQSAGAVSVPLSPLMSGSQLRDLLAHCDPGLVVVSDSGLAEKIRFGETGAAPVWILDQQPGGRGAPVSGPADGDRDLVWLARLARERVRPDSLLSILYTSGTTGAPRGVMLSQSNLVSNANAKVAALPLEAEDVRLCWLPMAHIFARLADLATSWRSGCLSVISRGRDHLFGEIRQFRPTYLNGVPWFYDRCCRISPSADGLREMLGGRIRLCNCGGAPLPRHVLEHFSAGHVQLVNGYGLTETSPVVTSNRPAQNRPGSVGQPVDGVSVQIDGQGVVCVRGPNVMLGYYRDTEGTAAVLKDGWLNTGDLGHLDGDGFLWITGRRKELIVTLTGRNIAPVPIENRLLASPLVQQCMVVGDNRNFLMALVVPNLQQEAAGRLLAGPDGREKLRDLILVHARESLADAADYEQIADVILVETPFTVENGLATPKQSLRRKQIAEFHSARIDEAYRTFRRDRLASAEI